MGRGVLPIQPDLALPTKEGVVTNEQISITQKRRHEVAELYNQLKYLVTERGASKEEIIVIIDDFFAKIPKKITGIWITGEEAIAGDPEASARLAELFGEIFSPSKKAKFLKNGATEFAGITKTKINMPSSSTSISGVPNASMKVKQYPDGSYRTPDGKFASKKGVRPPGTAAAEKFANFLQQNGMDVVGLEMVVDGPVGKRVYDLVLRDANGILHGIEVKTGGAHKNAYQEFTDYFVNQFGAAGKGRLSDETVSSATTVYLP